MVLVAAKSLESPLSTTVTFAGYYCARSAYHEFGRQLRHCLVQFLRSFDGPIVQPRHVGKVACSIGLVP
ncbi:hypothetical protein V2G26_005068 [Clonostachys chloroleuca]